MWKSITLYKPQVIRLMKLRTTKGLGFYNQPQHDENLCSELQTHVGVSRTADSAFQFLVGKEICRGYFSQVPSVKNRVRHAWEQTLELVYTDAKSARLSKLKFSSSHYRFNVEWSLAYEHPFRQLLAKA